jgi:3-dehydroquinate synthetase
VIRHLAAAGLPVEASAVCAGIADADRLVALMTQDKKVKRGALTFILLRDIGRAYIEADVDPALVGAFLVEKLEKQ